MRVLRWVLIFFLGVVAALAAALAINLLWIGVRRSASWCSCEVPSAARREHALKVSKVTSQCKPPPHRALRTHYFAWVPANGVVLIAATPVPSRQAVSNHKRRDSPC